MWSILQQKVFSRIFAISFALAPLAALAQSAPANLPAHTVFGRLGVPGDTGPGQAIPFANLPFTQVGIQSANTVYAGPSSGISAMPSFRALVSADIPPLSSLLGSIAPSQCPIFSGSQAGCVPAGFIGGVSSFEGLTGAIAASSSDKRIYVSTAGNDANTGRSPQSAKLTLQACINAANPSGICNVGAGTYTLTAVLNHQPGVWLLCEPGAFITQANGANLSAEIDYQPNNAASAIVDNCVVDGNRANNTASVAAGASVIHIGTVSGGTVRNSFIQNGTYSSDEDRLARGEYLAKHVTLSLALRSSGDAGRGFGRG